MVELAVEDVVLPHRDNPSQRISISPPRDEKGEAVPVHVRVLVHKLRKGRKTDGFGKKHMMATNSDGLLVHFHGGGFVSQSSKTHEIYLRDWARDLGITILSVDYSLAPEHPFPRGFNDCFFAYCWALANYTQLYTNAKFVCIAGDSAGGNLSVAVSLKAIECGIRVPDGIVPVYGPYLIRYSVSASRLLSVMDPLLHNGILIKCLGAYAGQEQSFNVSGVENDILEGSTSVDPTDSDIIQEMVGHNAAMFDVDYDDDNEYDDDNDDGSDKKVGETDGERDAQTRTDFVHLNENEFELVEDDDVVKPPSGGVFQESYRYQASVHMSAVQCTSNNSWSKIKTVLGSSEEHITSPVHRRGSAPDLTLRAKSPVTSQPALRHCRSEDPLQKSVDGLLPFCHPPITNNPYMSPYLASNELLSQLPPVYLIVSNSSLANVNSLIFIGLHRQPIWILY
jgi:hormone-sensitive lipase